MIRNIKQNIKVTKKNSKKQNKYSKKISKRKSIRNVKKFRNIKYGGGLFDAITEKIQAILQKFFSNPKRNKKASTLQTMFVRYEYENLNRVINITRRYRLLCMFLEQLSLSTADNTSSIRFQGQDDIPYRKHLFCAMNENKLLLDFAKLYYKLLCGDIISEGNKVDSNEQENSNTNNEDNNIRDYVIQRLQIILEKIKPSSTYVNPMGENVKINGNCDVVWDETYQKIDNIEDIKDRAIAINNLIENVKVERLHDSIELKVETQAKPQDNLLNRQTTEMTPNPIYEQSIESHKDTINNQYSFLSSNNSLLNISVNPVYNGELDRENIYLDVSKDTNIFYKGVTPGSYFDTAPKPNNRPSLYGLHPSNIYNGNNPSSVQYSNPYSVNYYSVPSNYSWSNSGEYYYIPGSNEEREYAVPFA